MIVVSDLQTRIAASLARTVKRVDKPFVMIECTLILLQVRNDDIALADTYRTVDFGLQIIADRRPLNVRRRVILNH